MRVVGKFSLAVCPGHLHFPAEEGVSEDTELTSTASESLFVCQDVSHLVTTEPVRKVGNECVSRKRERSRMRNCKVWSLWGSLHFAKVVGRRIGFRGLLVGVKIKSDT